MPNHIFSYGLSPKAVFVYAYLKSRANALSAVVASYQAIAENCHMDEKTAARAIAELLEGRLIIKETRHDYYRGKLKNKYLLYGIPGGWFKVDYQVFKTQIKATDFMIYCFIRSCMDAKRSEAFPSLNAIVKGTGLSHSRVTESVQYLRSYTFINRVRRHYRRTKAYRHNRYLLFRLNKKKTRLPQRVFQILKNVSSFLSSFKTIVEQEDKNVNRFFKKRGSPYFPHLL